MPWLSALGDVLSKALARIVTAWMERREQRQAGATEQRERDLTEGAARVRKANRARIESRRDGPDRLRDDPNRRA